MLARCYIYLKKTLCEKQLAKITDERLIKELKEYGCWEDFSDREENEQRIIWIAAGDISENLKH